MLKKILILPWLISVTIPVLKSVPVQTYYSKKQVFKYLPSVIVNYDANSDQSIWYRINLTEFALPQKFSDFKINAIKIKNSVRIYSFSNQWLINGNFLFQMYGPQYEWYPDLLPGINQFINENKYLNFKWRVYYDDYEMKMQFLSQSHLDRIYKAGFYIGKHFNKTYVFLASELTIDYSYFSYK